jgi:hypothetical protein
MTKGDLHGFTIPNWALCYFINADSSDLSDEELQQLRTFEDKISNEYGNASFMLGDEEDDLGFCHVNDIDNLGSNCTMLYLRPTNSDNK